MHRPKPSSKEPINVLTPCLSEQKTALLSHKNNLVDQC